MNIKTYIDILFIRNIKLHLKINFPIKNKINVSFDHRIETGQTFIKHVWFSFLPKSVVIFINFICVYIYIYSQVCVVVSEFPDTSVFCISFLVSAIIPIMSCEFSVISVFNSYRIYHYLHLLFLLHRSLAKDVNVIIFSITFAPCLP